MARCVPCVVLAVFLMLTGCQTLGSGATNEEADHRLRARVEALDARADSLARAAHLRNPLPHSTLWTQTAMEYESTARQAYRAAEIMMGRALSDSLWTAALEQAHEKEEACREKPPAVVLDVDETILGNSPCRAHLIPDTTAYGSQGWAAWVRAEQAEPVPGAHSVTRAAHRRGVQVICLTNRDAAPESAPQSNLRALGFSGGRRPGRRAPESPIRIAGGGALRV